MTVAVQADIEARLTSTFDSDPHPRVTAILQIAQELVEEFIGVPLQQPGGDITNDLTGNGGTTLRLPRWPLKQAPTSVVENGVTLVEDVDYTWAFNGTLTRLGTTGHPVMWNTQVNNVTVTYLPGWVDHTDVYRPLRQLVADVATRLWKAAEAWRATDGATGHVKQESIMGYSVTYRDLAEQEGGLTEGEQKRARRIARGFQGVTQT